MGSGLFDSTPDRSFGAYLRVIGGRRGAKLKLLSVGAFGAATWLDHGPIEFAVAVGVGLGICLAWYPFWRRNPRRWVLTGPAVSQGSFRNTGPGEHPNTRFDG
jgi:hypothetical protein